MQTRRILYWALAGALMGFGYIGILSIGFPFLLLGLGLVIFGLIRRWLNGLWAFLIGFGGLPALILVLDIVTAPPQCIPAPGGRGYTMPPGAQACGGPLGDYVTLAIIFGAIALVGVAWPLILLLWRRARRAGG